MLLGRCVWTRGTSGWCRESFDGRGGLANPAIARLAELLSCRCRRRTVVVFEPEGIAHQTVEAPRVSRSVYASLARVRSEHPVVLSEDLGWGIEYPEPVKSGAFSTLMHYELTPGLVHLHDACIHAGSQLSAAWSVFTVATACMKTRFAAQRARIVLILVPEFVAVAIFARGKRSFRRWTGPMADRDWKAVSALIGESEARAAPSIVEAELRRGSIAVIAEGNPERDCPIWEEIRATGRLEAVAGLEAMLAGAARITSRHPGNLVEGFPRQRQLDRYLIGATVGCLSVAAALGAAVPTQLRQLKSLDASSASRVTALESHLAGLRSNQKEMEMLRNEAAQGPGLPQVGRHEALLGLAAVVPDALTLTSVTISKDDRFAFEAVVVGTDFDPEDTRRALDRRGFNPEGPNGWAFNSKSGMLSVSGRYSAPQP